jgi:hypothetical protein
MWPQKLSVTTFCERLYISWQGLSIGFSSPTSVSRLLVCGPGVSDRLGGAGRPGRPLLVPQPPLRRAGGPVSPGQQYDKVGLFPTNPGLSLNCAGLYSRLSQRAGEGTVLWGTTPLYYIAGTRPPVHPPGEEGTGACGKRSAHQSTTSTARMPRTKFCIQSWTRQILTWSWKVVTSSVLFPSVSASLRIAFILTHCLERQPTVSTTVPEKPKFSVHYAFQIPIHFH